MTDVGGITIVIWESGVRNIKRRRLRFFLKLLHQFIGSSIFSLMLASPAFADQLDPAKSIEVTVHGRVSEHCAMGQINNMAFGDLTRPGLTAATRVRFSCNVPFDMTIQAAHGGLANLQYPQEQGPYSGVLLFNLDIAIPVRKPTPSFVGRRFSSQQLMGGATLSSSGGIATEDLLLSIELGTASREAGLLAGQYSEVITVTVSAS